MFSGHRQKVDRSGSKNLFVIAGALVILGQVGAMAMLADGQVKKAELRESQMTLQRVALAQCFESNLGTARSSCMSQLYNEDSSPLASGKSVSNNTMAIDGSVVRAPAQGAMAVSYAN